MSLVLHTPDSRVQYNLYYSFRCSEFKTTEEWTLLYTWYRDTELRIKQSCFCPAYKYLYLVCILRLFMIHDVHSVPFICDVTRVRASRYRCTRRVGRVLGHRLFMIHDVHSVSFNCDVTRVRASRYRCTRRVGRVLGAVVPDTGVRGRVSDYIH